MKKCGFKVALVDLDGQIVPVAIRQALCDEGITFVFRDCRTREELAETAGDADIVWLFGGSRILGNGHLSATPRCRAIVRTGSGTDNVPVEEASRKGIIVANTPEAFSDAVSDHLVALLFSVVRRIPGHDRSVRAGQWRDVSRRPLSSVQGRTLGMVGFGLVAREVVRKLSGFRMRVLAFDPYVQEETIITHGAASVSLEELLSESDFISIHCPLTPGTKHLIGEQEFRRMKPGAILLNTARGPVIDEAALVKALREGRIAGAGLDVFEDEPAGAAHPLLALDNVVLTPHVAGDAVNGMELRWKLSLETILALSRGQVPRSCVSPSFASATGMRPREDG